MKRKSRIVSIALIVLASTFILSAKPASAGGGGAFGHGMTTGNWTPWLIGIGMMAVVGIINAKK